MLLIAFGGLAVWIAMVNSRHFVEELEQRLQHDLAAHLADELAPALRHGARGAPVKAAARRLRAINPSLELYLLDARGNLVAYLMGRKPLARKHVAVAPIRAFLAGEAPLPIRGDDPSEPVARKIFSAAPVAIGPPRDGRYRHGYLYVILHGMPYASQASMLHESYIVRTGAATLAIAVAFAAVVGLLLFALLTRRFRRLTATVTRFKEGAYDERVRDTADDEIGRLGRAFNDMAATIEAQVQALERTDATRRELVANVSHDLRTPLTSLRGYAERLQARPDASAADTRQWLDSILHNADRLERLVRELSLLSRLDARQLEPSFESFPMTELVQDVLVKFKPGADAAGVSLKADYDSALPPVRADLGLVERALSNLVDNAVRNTAVGGKVRVTLEPEDGRVRVTVTDTGRGIPENELALVTQRFYRTAASRAGDGGSGLGLSIASEIAALHGSRLTLTSRVGVGTRVSFSLPVDAPG